MSYDKIGDKNPNWKGGISLDSKMYYRYRKENDPYFKERQGEYHKKYMNKNKERWRAYYKLIRETNIEKAREYEREWKRQWRLKNPTQARVYDKQWKKKHPEKVSEYWRKWYSRSKRTMSPQMLAYLQRKNQRRREWGKKNGDKVRFIKLRRYHRERATEGDFTAEEWALLKKKYKYTCPACGRKEPKIKLSIDHIIPISKGGTNYIWNIQPLCLECNLRKYDKILVFNTESKR